MAGGAALYSVRKSPAPQPQIARFCPNKRRLGPIATRTPGIRLSVT